jgi:hypothetical protein
MVINFREYCERKFLETVNPKYIPAITARCLNCQETISFSLITGLSCSEGCETREP